MNEYDDLTTRLSQTLADHSDAMAGSSLGLGDVQGRARSIRRRRTATAVAGAAAAVALLVPTVALASHTNATHNEPGPATQTPTSTQTATTVDTDAPLDVQDLPAGEAPRTGYLEGQTLHLPDGSTAATGTADPASRVVLLTDGTAVYQTRDDQGVTHVEVVDGAGDRHGPYGGQEGLLGNATHTLAAWIGTDGYPVAWQSGDTAPLRLSTKAGDVGLQLDGVIGDDCTGDPGCRMLVRSTDSQTGEVHDVVVSSRNGLESAGSSGGDWVNALSESGLRAVYTATGDTSSCSSVVTADGQRMWRTCDHQVTSFSPDSDRAAAYLPYFDGVGSSDIGAYDVASGQVLFDHQSTRKTQAFVASSVWEDDSHLLGTTFQGGSWYVVRYGVDGSMEIAAGPQHADMGANPYVLPGQR